ncbi:hypothetical protein SAMN04515647_2740 [Cohaesibacter sp. ES.047]|uniref:CAF17-like 4Fe-4S cluster assembly/insertion protein YgfZ n=1 Tax=Cohaesibacter sp. ES.047 TaxID=1798205 RepID=UPI000BC0B1A5|nr:folate-binding protein YgfZ [Cohaesibacter sp. ES.047]SNY92466.1 hypothetical protein SAMN04515647_2740 [Cohaesibacter sp. ES.047]
MSIHRLADRTLVLMSGSEVEPLLQRLITTDLDDLEMGKAGYGALLTPQGKIIMDFLVARKPEGFLFDLASSSADEFVKKMTLYRMRSDVTIDKLDAAVGLSFTDHPDAVADPRSELLGYRLRGEPGAFAVDEAMQAEYEARRVRAVVADSGKDFSPGDVFPHDINMDCLEGLDFAKGCYVGQEVVSRMKHRGTARRRLVAITAGVPLPESGTQIMADNKPIGTLGTVSGTAGLAIVRFDRVSEAIKESQPMFAGEAEVAVTLPTYASFSLND